MITAVRPGPALVTVVMANFNGMRHLNAAIRSVLDQSHANLELIVVDDASTDASATIINEWTRADGRVRAILQESNGGPARARNAALAMAKGEWIAIVDADDQIHPERLERLILAAEGAGADIVADDLLHFYEDGSPVTFLLPADWRDVRPITALDWIEGGSRPDMPALGYLKPLIRRSIISRRRYDETMRIGEDWELVLQLLLAGASMIVLPQPWYLYRRHAGSISHRLSSATLEAMMRVDDGIPLDHCNLRPDITRALAHRRSGLLAQLEVQKLIEAIKRRDAADGLAVLMAAPRSALGLGVVMAGRLRARGTPVHSANVPPLPDYAPPEARDALRIDRSIWEQLVNAVLTGRQNIRLEGPAGRYAAGFLPQDLIKSQVVTG
ncbi:glycosyltransferase family 2 protein [Devosia sp. Naph2]|uniref:glycosyltransferase family 2 protein n=1 Tax=Devosia polycyclovorans TaxID=3345148 RepID=UPI0035D06EB9